MRKEVDRLFLLIVISSFISCIALGQEEFTRYKNQELKKKKEGWGIKRDGDWPVPAEYDRIEQSGSRLLAWKGDKLDVYRQYYLNLLLKNISIKDTSFLFSFTRFEDPASVIFENQQLGWKYKDRNIAASYDSVRMISTKDIQVYQKGKTAVLSKEGDLIIPSGSYDKILSFPGYYITYRKDQQSGNMLQGRFELLKKEIPPVYASINSIQEDKDVYYGSERVKRFYEAKLITGQVDYYDANTLSKLPEIFASVYAPIAAKRQTQQKLKEEEQKKKIVQLETRATLRVFRDGNKGLGLITSSGTIYMPSGLAKINYRTVSWFARYGGKGLTRTEYTITDGKKTVSTRDFDEDTAMLYFDKGLASFPLKIAIRNIEDYYVLAVDHTYKNPLMLSANCGYCKAGKITAVLKDEITTREIAPATEVTVTQKKVSGELDKEGKFPVYSKTYKSEAITETTKTTKLVSPEKTCSICRGSGISRTVLSWNEGKKMYEETSAGH